MTLNKKISMLVLILFFLLLCTFGEQASKSVTTSSDATWLEEDHLTAQEVTDAASSGSIEVDQTAARSFQGNVTGTIRGGHQMLQSSSVSNSASFTRHMMCKGFDNHYNPIEPTTIFKPSDAKVVCLTTVTIKDKIEFRWHYRSNSSKTWVSCLNVSKPAQIPDGKYHEYYYEGHLLIAGHELYYPRAYKVEVYLDGSFSFSEFFEITNGGLNSPRICEDVDENGNPVNMKSRFTIGNDTKAHHHLRFDKIAYFNEELECCHDFTTVWIQPDGSAYKMYSGSFDDYKDTNVTWNCWKYNYTQDDYISINSSTPVGNWKVEVYLDSYYFNNTWLPYGPIATTPFIVGSEPVADWTFMVYLDADNSLEKPGIEIFLKMANVSSSSRVNIVVQMDRISEEELEDDTRYDDTRYGDWTDCKLFNVTKGITPTPGNATLDLGEVNMGHPDTLKDFVNWTIRYYPANHYFLVLWDHGIGCFGLCFDITNADSLSLPELSHALSGLPAIMDVVFLDACSMSMTEVTYQIEDCANVLVGPEGLGYAMVDTRAVPYDHYLSSLTSDPSMSPSTIATEVVMDYIEWCDSEFAIQNATMSATDITKITSLMAAIDDFALTLKEKETSYYEQIGLARSLTEGYPGPFAGQSGYFIDLYHFAQRIYQYVLDEELQNAADQMMTTLESIIIIEAGKVRPDSHGLSISFPDKKEKYEDANFGVVYEETAFAKDSPWDEFVKYHLSWCTLTIQTPYSDIAVKVDEESHTTDADKKIRIFVLPGNHTINATTPVSTRRGWRGIFDKWNDSYNENPRILFVNRTLTLEAEYETQCRLIIDTNFGTTNPPVGENWCEAGSTIEISATAPSVISGEQYDWLGWTGIGNGSHSNTDKPAYITMNGPINETATWIHKYQLTVTSPHGSPTPTTDWFEAGGSITAKATSPESGQTGTQYVCTGWTGTGSVPTSGTNTSVTFTIDDPSSITWNWKTQYGLVVHTDPAGLSPQPKVSPEAQGRWYDNGMLVNCTAQKIGGRVFDYWTVDDVTWDPGINLLTITMDKPHEATAHYVRALTWWENLLRPEILQVVLGLMGVVLTVTFVGAAWFRTRRRRGVIKALLDEVDEVYSRFKTNPRKCEEELYRLRNTILEGLTDGKIPEESYNILDKRIDKYTEELQSVMKARAEPAAIEVSEVLPDRITTGYGNLDNLLFGGIPKNYAVILTSPSCDERDLLIKKFLETGAKKGEATFYVTIDPGEVRSLAEEFQSNFYLFICNPQADKVIKSLPNVFKLKGVENLTAISIALTKAFRRLDESITGPRRTCIEIISDVLLQHHAVQTRRWLTELITELKSRGFTTLAVMNPQMHPSQEVHAIRDLFEGEINIYEKETEKGLEKFLKIKKMYNQRYLESELPLKKEKLET